jgi:hypothetical protein
MMRDGERGVDRAWTEQVEAVLTGLADWQTAHPSATLAEIEAAVEVRLGDLRARMMERALLTAAQAHAAAPPAPCPLCGGVLQARGQHTRTVRLRGDRPVQIRRPYQTCAACGHGLFPP